MFKKILNPLRYGFSIELQNAYSLKYKVKDVVKIRGLKSAQPYVIIQNKRIGIPYKKMLIDIIASSPFNIINQPPLTSILDNSLNLIHPTASTVSILSTNFYIKINNDLYFVANNENLITQSLNPQFIALDSPESLQPIIKQTLTKLQELSEIRPVNLNTMVIKNVLDHSIEFKIQKVRLKELLKVIQNKLLEYEQRIKVINQDVLKKSNKKMKYFTSFILTQYAFVHWLIYFHLSWDIMQPVTVLLANIDLLIGYYFFVFKGKNYTLQQIQQSIFQKHKFRYLKKYGVNVQKYEELLQLKEFFQMKMDLLSKSPHVLMDRLQKPIKFLDTR